MDLFNINLFIFIVTFILDIYPTNRCNLNFYYNLALHPYYSLALHPYCSQALHLYYSLTLHLTIVAQHYILSISIFFKWWYTSGDNL